MWMLILLNVFLFVGSYAAGCIPLLFHMSPAKLRFTTIFGAGLLLGAALAIIIPEGVEALYTAHQQSVSHVGDSAPQAIHYRAKRADFEPKPVQPNVELKNKAAVASADFADPSVKQHQVDDFVLLSFREPHQRVGLALLIGFLFMLLVEQISALTPRGSASCCCCWLPSSRGWTTCSWLRSKFCYGQTNSTGSTALNGQLETERRLATATLGLFVHSFADGLAMGAAFALGQVRLEMILFFAILLHKAPAAFGLVCYLLHDGLSRDRIRLHLFVFACAAPLAAFLTYFYLTFLPSGDSVAASSQTGFALLLSGGTFLYVAASHILPELASAKFGCEETAPSKPSDSESNTHDYTLLTVTPHEPKSLHSIQSGSERGLSSSLVRSGFNLCETVLYLTGALVPLFLTMGHSH